MIIHCPNCQTRYNLTPQQLGPNGRKVRCVKCAHEWFQPATAAETAATPTFSANTAGATPQPQNTPDTPSAAPTATQTPSNSFTPATAAGVATAAPAGATPPLPPENPFTRGSVETDVAESRRVFRQKMLITGSVATSLLFLVFAVVFALRGPLVEAAPFMRGFYGVFGLANSNHGLASTSTGLVIGDVERSLAEDDGITVLIFTGTLTNTNSEDVPVVAPRVSIMDERGIELDSFPALARKKYLKPGEQTTWVCRFFDPPLERIYEYKVFFESGQAQAD